MSFWRDLKVSYYLDKQTVTENVVFVSEENRCYTYLPKMELVLVHYQDGKENLDLIRKLTISTLLSQDRFTLDKLFLTREDYESLLKKRTFEDYEKIPCRKCSVITHFGKDDWICGECDHVYCQWCIEESGQYSEDGEDWFCNKC